MAKTVANRKDGVGWDRARFYEIDGHELPSVTTILDVVSKPALGPWYAKEERRVFETAMLEVAAKYHTITGEQLVEAVIATVAQVKAGDRAKQQAGSIGTAIHAGIEWHLRTQMGEDPGPYPELPDAAIWGIEAWRDWAKSAELEPLAIERQVYCLEPTCFYAGTMDLYARVRGVLTVLDWKSGKAIYPEAYLQNIAYRHAADRLGMPSAQGMIIRLPKLMEDPGFEVAFVPAVTLAEFQGAAVLWRAMRRLEGKRVGMVPRVTRERVGVNSRTGEW